MKPESITHKLAIGVLQSVVKWNSQGRSGIIYKDLDRTSQRTCDSIRKSQ